MNQRSQQFWRDRYARQGHTGWRDPVIYAYDQLERLAIVGVEISRLAPPPHRAIDFGCGSGDFSRLLLRSGLQVYGIDPFVRPDINDPAFFYLPALADARPSTRQVDLILSVTVLDHVLDEGVLLRTLRVMRSLLKPLGNLILVEYALDQGDTRSATDYQAFRGVEDWHRILAASGLEITTSRPIPAGPASPSPGFQAFAKNPAAKWLGRNSVRNSRRGNLARRVLTSYANWFFARYGVGTVDQSPLKLMLCRRDQKPMARGATNL